MANQELLEQIEAAFEEGRETYGSPRVYRMLKRWGVPCSEKRIARLMRLRGLKAKQTRRFRATTKRQRTHAVAPNLLQRDFAAQRPDQKWLADITYISTWEGWLYLAAILDMYSRRIVGWAMAEQMTDALTLGALRMALQRRRPGLLAGQAGPILKSECVHHAIYRTRDEARADLFSYIEVFYNRRRLHSALAYLSPEEYEQEYHHQLFCLTPCPQN